MPKLNDADALYLGDTEVDKVYLGTTEIWPSAPVFSPTDIAGMTVWFDADDAATFTFASGVIVSQWNDKSGNARHAAQATGAKQPSRNGTINGRTTVVFDGTADEVHTSNAVFVNASTGQWTSFCVFKATSGSGLREIVGIDSASRQAIPARLNTTNAQTGAFNTAPTSFVDSAGAVTNGVAYQLCGVRAATTIECFLDGTSGGSTATTGTPATATTALTLGTRNHASASAWLPGEIAEFIMYDTALSTPDRQSVEAYLRGKWGTA